LTLHNRRIEQATQTLRANFANVEQNHFKKTYRAKPPRAQRKIFFLFSEPWRLCVFARVIFFPILQSKNQAELQIFFARVFKKITPDEEEQAMDFQQEKYAKGAPGYDERICKLFPFYETIHTAINAVLRVYLGAESEILIVGAGTGGEILELGKTNPGWRFLGVDPAKPMLDLAKEKIEAAGLADRVSLVNGFIGDLPISKLYDGATAAMIMHFVPDDGGKIEFLRAIASHLKTGAPLVLMDANGDLNAPESELLIEAWKQQQVLAGVKSEEVESAMKERMKAIQFVSSKRIEELLAEAGFYRIQRFFQNFMLVGWVAFKRQP
jgi:tRNA (cmo5U34)-methyltransferase